MAALTTIVKKLNGADVPGFKELLALFEDVFEMKDFSMPDDVYLQGLLASADFHVFAAFQEQTVLGGLTAYTLKPYYTKRPLAYIYDLAVSRAHQRKGIGRQLIRYVNDHFRVAGYEEVFVQADKADDYALDFYRKTMPSDEEDVSHFYYTLKTWQ